MKMKWKRFNLISTIANVILIGTFILRYFIELPDFIYGLGIGTVGGLIIAALIEMWYIKKQA